MYPPTLFFTLSHYACSVHTSCECDDVHSNVIERRYSSPRESTLSPGKLRRKHQKAQTRLRRKHNSCEQRPDCASKLRPQVEIRRRSSNSSVGMGRAISSLWQHESRRCMARKSSFATGMCRSCCRPRTLKQNLLLASGAQATPGPALLETAPTRLAAPDGFPVALRARPP